MTPITKHSHPTLFLLLLGAAYAILFYHAETGVNLLLFDALLITAALKCRPELAKHKAFIWSVAGLLFAALSVIIVHGAEAIFAHHLTYFVVLGFAQARELRFIWYGFLLGGISLFRGPLQWVKHHKKRLAEAKVSEKSAPTQITQWLRQGLLPLIILIPFVLFYLLGNDVLAAAAEHLLNGISLFSIDVSPFWMFLLFLTGTLLTLPLLFNRLESSYLVGHQLTFNDRLRNDDAGDQSSGDEPQVPKPDGHQAQKTRGHYRQAVITFVLLNTLITIANVTDLAFVWLPANDLSAATLSHYVHVGTWNLTFSIGLAMLVVLYYFRGNLNFLANAPLLRPLARLWLAQNALLALSVGIRNYHYIDAYGLAGGRVIVGFVLLLILFGLYTLLRKIDHRLSLSYLLQTNGLAAWLLLLAFSAVNWSGVITRYNLATQSVEEVDWHYLRSGLDQRNTFLLLNHPEARLDLNLKTYAAYYQPADWRSWNYADWRSLRALRQYTKAGKTGTLAPARDPGEGTAN